MAVPASCPWRGSCCARKGHRTRPEAAVISEELSCNCKVTAECSERALVVQLTLLLIATAWSHRVGRDNLDRPVKPFRSFCQISVSSFVLETCQLPAGCDKLAAQVPEQGIALRPEVAFIIERLSCNCQAMAECLNVTCRPAILLLIAKAQAHYSGRGGHPVDVCTQFYHISVSLAARFGWLRQASCPGA